MGRGGAAPELSLLLVNTASESICGIKVANENWWKRPSEPAGRVRRELNLPSRLIAPPLVAAVFGLRKRRSKTFPAHFHCFAWSHSPPLSGQI